MKKKKALAKEIDGDLAELMLQAKQANMSNEQGAAELAKIPCNLQAWKELQTNLLEHMEIPYSMYRRFIEGYNDGFDALKQPKGIQAKVHDKIAIDTVMGEEELRIAQELEKLKGT